MARPVLYLAVAVALGVGATSILSSGAHARTTPPVPLPGGWSEAATGGSGGAVWSGVIPNPRFSHERPSAVYLPPGFLPTRRYPVLYLLHGLPGSPASYVHSLHIASVLDQGITSGRLVPMLVVMPAGPRKETSEWAGSWETYLVRDVIPWTDSHLPAIGDRSGRVLGGLCAGGYGSLDAGLRHDRLFAGLESWEGYFAPVFHDGPFRHATRAYLAANDPTLLVDRKAPALRGEGMRFFISAGGPHGLVHAAWSHRFAALLTRLGLAHTFVQLPRNGHHLWSGSLPPALAFASSVFARATT